MADFKTHITTSSVLGVGYAALGAYYGLPIEAALVAGGLCSLGGMLPDIDSDSGVPVRETMGFAAAVVPMLLVDRFEHMGLNYEQMVLAAGGTYCFVRFGIARMLMRYTHHRGMFHSIPALLIFTGLAFLLCGFGNLHLRYFKAGGVFLGTLSHLVLDEIWSVDWERGRWRFKSSFGTALKLWGDSMWANFSAYSKLAVVVMMILSEPMVMERYGQWSPIVVNNEALRERLHLAPNTPIDPALVAMPAYGPQVYGAPTLGAPSWGAPTYGASQYGAPVYGAAPADVLTVAPTGGARPGLAPGAVPDQDIYDTARRIWDRIRN